MCVQSFDDSRGFAIRNTYRISLRSSSLWEPRHPLLKFVFKLCFLFLFRVSNVISRECVENHADMNVTSQNSSVEPGKKLFFVLAQMCRDKKFFMFISQS